LVLFSGFGVAAGVAAGGGGAGAVVFVALVALVSFGSTAGSYNTLMVLVML
jgi:hypothetical protein